MASSDEDDSEQIGNKVSSERRKRKTRTFYKSWEDLSNSGKRHRERNMKKKLEQGLEVRAVEEVPINNISNSSRIEVDNASQVNEQQDLVFTSDDTCSEIYSKYPSLSSQFEVPSPCSSSVSDCITFSLLSVSFYKWILPFYLGFFSQYACCFAPPAELVFPVAQQFREHSSTDTPRNGCNERCEQSKQ